jgi:TRAP-type C4-dicarboxylate transport system permease small subunit
MPQARTRHPVRQVLDVIYKSSGVVAAAFLLILLFIIVLQMVMRWSGGVFIGATNYAGYCMAAASFFALAYALNNGAHIRVGLLLNQLGRYRRIGEIWCFGIGSALSVYFMYYAYKGVYWSYKLNDVSQGQDATPLWLPQIPMALGTTVLALTFVDHFIRIVFFGLDDVGDDAITADEHV